jgi:hypothetical protein
MMINAYKYQLGEERARCLAGVWANIHFLGCEYGPEVMALIREWPKPNQPLKCVEAKSTRESPPHFHVVRGEKIALQNLGEKSREKIDFFLPTDSCPAGNH